MKLSVKNTVILSVLVGVSLVGLSSVSYFKSKSIIEEDFERLAVMEMTSIQNNIDIWVQGKEDLQQAAASLDIAKEMDVESILTFNDRLNGILPSTETAYALIGKNGFVFLPGGQTVDISGYEHYQRGIKGEIGTYGPTTSVRDGQPIILSFAPVLNHKEEIVGVMNGGYYTEDLVNIISKIKLGETGYATVFTEDGTIVAHPKKDKILTNLSKEKNKTVNDVIKKAMSGKTGVTEGMIDGKDSLIYYSYSDTVNWGMMVTVPKEEAFAQSNELLAVLIPATLVALLVIAFINYTVMRSSLKPLTFINEQIKGLATEKGDLSTRLSVKSNNEIGELSANFNLMLDNLEQLIKESLNKGETVSENTYYLNQNVEQLRELSETITNNIQEIAEVSNEQLNGYTENLEDIETISSNISSITGSTSVLADESSKIFEQAKVGNEKIEKLEEQMTIIQTTVNRSSEAVENLSVRSKEIGNIVNIIASISDQTNLLSLNASIEAARAGEHGKGFLVVAEEVKKLAKISNDSSKQIYDIIQKIQTETADAVKEMEKGTKEVDIGAEKVKEVGSLLHKIVHSTKSSAEQIDIVSHETEELAQRTDEVKNRVKDSTYSVETSSAYLQEIASSSQEQLAFIANINESIDETSTIAKGLQDSLKTFKVTEDDSTK